MHTTIGLIIIAEVLVMAAILVCIYHENALIALEDRVFALLKARRVANKRARAKAYLKKTAPAKPRTETRAAAPARGPVRESVRSEKSLRVLRGGRYTDAA